MDLQFVKTFGQIAGIGGVALGVLLLLYRDIIRKAIFPRLDRLQAFRLLTLIVILVWSIAVAGIVAWVYVGGSARNAQQADLNWKRDLEVVLSLREPAQITEPDGTTFGIVFRQEYIDKLSSLNLQDDAHVSGQRDQLVMMTRRGRTWNERNPDAVIWTSAMAQQLALLRARIRAVAASRHVDVERVECLSGMVARC